MYQATLAGARVTAGLSQREVCEAINVSKSTLVNWEKGHTVPKMDQVMKLCELYKCPVESLKLPEQA